MKSLRTYITESGSIGGNRIKRENVKPTVDWYEKEILSKFPDYQKLEITGSYNTGKKKDHGDIDLCIWINSKEDIKKVRRDFKKYIESLPDEMTPKFRIGRKQGEKAQMYGTIVTCQVPVVGHEDEYVQIDNILVLSPEELVYQKSFLNLNAQVQSICSGLIRVLSDEKKEQAYKHFGINELPDLQTNQEYEFVMANNMLSLRKVTLSDEKKTLNVEEIWRSFNWEDVEYLLDLSINSKNVAKQDYDDILDRTAEVYKNDERARRRICGKIVANIHIGPGEKGTPKGDDKQHGIDMAYQMLGIEKPVKENYGMQSIKKFLLK